MYDFLIFLIELLILFLLSKSLTTSLFVFFYKTTHSKKFSIYLLSILFLPGTVIHELAHATMAILLQVPVGKMEFIPKLSGNNLKMGSVEIGQADPIRRILIGLAPFLFGTTIIIWVFIYAVQNDLFSYKLYVIVISYLVFEIGNTMFSSKKDLEGAFEVIIALIFVCLAFYIVGFRIPSLNPEIIFSNTLIIQTLRKANTFMLAPLGIDLFLVLVLKLLKY